MLTITHLKAASVLVGQFDAMHYGITPIVNTPLGSITADLYVPVANSLDANKEWTPHLPSYIDAANSITPGQDCSIYNLNMDKTAAIIANHVRAHFSFARNVVKPIISSIVEEFNDIVRNRNISASVDFKIIKRDLPLPMLNSGVKVLVDVYKKVGDVSSELPNFRAPDKAPQEIIEMMLTGDDDIDNDIRAWAATVGDAEMMSIYDRAFGTPKTTYPKNKLVSSAHQSWNSTLAVFLISRQLFDKPWEGCNMSLAKFNSAIGAMRDYAGKTLSDIYEVYVSMNKTGILVLNTDEVGKVVTVNTPVYDEWIAGGNSDAVLYGMVAAGKFVSQVSTIDAEKATYIKAWDNYVNLYNAEIKNRRFSVMKRAYYECVMRAATQHAKSIFGNIYTEDSEIDLTTTKEFAEFKKCMDALYNSLNDQHFINIWATTKHVVCDKMFGYTDSGKILDAIEDACRENPEIELGEAVRISYIRYVSRYVASQMVVNKIV